MSTLNSAEESQADTTSGYGSAPFAAAEEEFARFRDLSRTADDQAPGPEYLADSGALIMPSLKGLAEAVNQALREARIPASEAIVADGAVVTFIPDRSRAEEAIAIVRRLAASWSDTAAGWVRH